MGSTGKKRELPDHKDRESTTPPTEADDGEDGDIATPKRDRHGDDDQPL